MSGPPCTTLSTPGGSPASSASSASQQRRARVLFRGLEHERIAARHRQREHEARQHHREVERGDAGADAERLDERVDVDAAGGILRVFAELQRCDRTGVLHHLRAASHLALRVGQCLAVLAGDQRRQLGGVIAQQLLEPQHDAHARRLRGVAPRLVRGLGRGDGRVQLVCRRERHARDHFLRGRVDDIAPLGGLRFDPLAVDQQREGRNGHGSLLGKPDQMLNQEEDGASRAAVAVPLIACLRQRVSATRTSS